MAVVGDATIIVRAITDKVKDDITKGLKGLNKAGEDAGKQFGESFLEGFGDELNDGLGDTLDKAFEDASESAINAGRDAGKNFIDGFNEDIDADDTGDRIGRALNEGILRGLGDKGSEINRVLGEAGGSNVGDRVGRELNAGIMRGLGDKEREIGDLLESAGSAAGERFNESFSSSSEGIARSLEDSLNNGDYSGVGDNITNSLADSVIPNMSILGAEIGRVLASSIGDELSSNGGGIGRGLFSVDPFDAISDQAERISSEYDRAIRHEMDSSDPVDVGSNWELSRDSYRRINNEFATLQDDIRARFNPVASQMSNALNKVFSAGGGGGRGGFGGLFSISPSFAAEARAASEAFTTLYAIGQFIGPVLGVVIGAIGTLAVGVVELGAVIGKAIPAGVAVAGASLSSLIQGFATIKIATIGFGDAFKKALKAQAAADQFGKGSDEYIKANEAALAILQKLSPEAQSFLGYVVSLRKEGLKLRDAAGSGLFPALESSLKRLNAAYFPSLIRILKETGTALGSVATEVTNVATTEKFIKRFNKVADTNNKLITISGRVIANLVDIVNTFLVAAGPVTIRFAEWVEGLTAAWRESLNTKGAVGRLKDTLSEAGDVMAQLGRILGNIGRGLGALGRAAEPAGQRLLDSFEGATEKFEDFMKSLEDNDRAAKYFDDVAANVEAIGRFFVALGVEWAKLGDNPAIGKTADALVPLTALLGDILDQLTDAGPAMTDFLTSLSEFLKLLTDAEAIQTFLDTLTLIVDGLNAVLSTEWGMKFLLFVGPIIAFHRALAFAAKIATFFWKVIIGGFLNLPFATNILNALKFTIGYLVRVSLPALGSAIAAVFAANPVGAVVVAIVAVGAALAAFFTWLYKNNEGFKKWVDGVWQGIKDAAGKIGEFFSGIWDTIQEGWQGLVDALQPAIEFFTTMWDTISDAVSTGVGIIKAALEPVVVFLVGWWSILYNIVKGGVTIFLAIFKPLLSILLGWWKVLGTIFLAGAKAVWGIFKTMAGFIWSIVKTLFGALKSILQTLFVIFYIPIKIVIGLGILAFKALFKIVSGIIKALIAVIKAVWGALEEIFGGPVRATLVIVKTVFNAINTKIREVVGGIVSWIKPKLGRVKEVFETIFGGIKTFVKGVFEGIQSVIEGAIDGIKLGINGFITIINGLIGGVNKVTGAINKLPGVDIPTISEIPKLASGGTVLPSSGGTLALLAEGGRAERVEPLDSSGLSSGDRAILEALKSASGKEVNVVVNNYYPEPERPSENLAMSMRVAREYAAGV